MGWLHEDAPGHEGYVVGLVPEVRAGGYASWHELAYPDDMYERPVRIRVIQVGCDCGWRSRRLRAPVRAEWHPFVVSLNDEGVERDARALWEQHIEEERARRAPLLEPSLWEPHQL